MRPATDSMGVYEPSLPLSTGTLASAVFDFVAIGGIALLCRRRTKQMMVVGREMDRGRRDSRRDATRGMVSRGSTGTSSGRVFTELGLGQLLAELSFLSSDFPTAGPAVLIFVLCGAPHPQPVIFVLHASPLHLHLPLSASAARLSGFLQASPPVRELDQGRTSSFPRMPSDGSPKDRQSLSYLLRSGFAGGVAGCVVRLFLFLLLSLLVLPPTPSPLCATLYHHLLTALAFRRRRSSHRLTESRSSSRHPTPSFRSMPVRPLLHPAQPAHPLQAH